MKGAFGLYAGLLLLGGWLRSPSCFAQPRHQGLLWPALGVHLGEAHCPVGASFTLQSRFTGPGSRFQVLLGTAHLEYRTPLKRLSLAGGYAHGLIHRAGRVQLLQGYACYQAASHKAQPVLRLAYDYLWLSPGRESTPRTAGVHRLRVLAGASPRLGNKYHLLFTAEPFLLRQGDFGRECRGQAGLRRKVSGQVMVDVLYFSRWQNPPSGHHWEHALNVFLHYAPGRVSRHLFHGR
jgi:hypothetical protein